MRLVITGAAGFIGSHLVDRLLESGHEVVGVDNLLTGSMTNLTHHEASDRFDFIELDVGLSFEHALLTDSVDGVFHLACPASPVEYLRHPLETMRVSAEGTKNVLEFCAAKKARFLLASTSEVYGDPDVHPQVETYWGNVNPNGPRSVYDEGKRFAEALACAYERLAMVDVRIARIFNTYGPRMRLADGRVLPAFGCAAIRGEPLPIFGDGTQTRSLCYVADLAAGLVKLFESDVLGPVNLGNPQELTMLELAEEIIAVAGSESGIEFKPLPQDDPRRRRPSIDRAKNELGWEPKVDRREGLRSTLDDFRARLSNGDS